jgi:hypothetical protein
MSELVKFLCTGEHPLEANPRPKTREAMKEYLTNGYVHVKFSARPHGRPRTPCSRAGPHRQGTRGGSDEG